MFQGATAVERAGSSNPFERANDASSSANVATQRSRSLAGSTRIDGDSSVPSPSRRAQAFDLRQMMAPISDSDTARSETADTPRWLDGVVPAPDTPSFGRRFWPMLALGRNIIEGLVGGVLYGGLTEEVMMRWGLLSLVAWVLAKIVRGRSTSALPFVVAIIITAIAFAAGH